MILPTCKDSFGGAGFACSPDDKCDGQRPALHHIKSWLASSPSVPRSEAVRDLSTPVDMTEVERVREAACCGEGPFHPAKPLNKSVS